jgi:hypothetical protein
VSEFESLHINDTHAYSHALSLSLSKNTQISSFMKFHPVGSELFLVDRWTEGCTDRQTDMTKLIVALHNFVNVTKKSKGQLKQRSDRQLSKLLKNQVFTWLV